MEGDSLSTWLNIGEGEVSGWCVVLEGVSIANWAGGMADGEHEVRKRLLEHGLSPMHF